jgi:uncharacterized membrane protein
MHMMETKKQKLTQNILMALFVALEAILAFTPIGFIMVPPIAITILHIPVIICSVIMGWKYGAVLGTLFGLFSMIRATTAGNPGDILFSPFTSGAPLSSVVLCFAPRILLGIVPYFIYKLINKEGRREGLAIGVSAGLSTLMHSFLVLFFLWLFFKAFPLYTVFATIVSLNCVVEFIAAVIIGIAVCKAILKYRSQI